MTFIIFLRIQAASKVPAAGVSMNYDLVRKGTFKVADIKELIDWKVWVAH